MKINNKNFGNILKELRLSKNMSQEALAAELNISRSAIAKYENNLGVPSEEVIDDICKYFDVDESYFADSSKIYIHKDKVIYEYTIRFLISSFFFLLYVLLFKNNIYFYNPIKLIDDSLAITVLKLSLLFFIPTFLVVFIMIYIIKMYILLFNHDKKISRKTLVKFQFGYLIAILFFFTFGFFYINKDLYHILYITPHLIFSIYMIIKCSGIKISIQ